MSNFIKLQVRRLCNHIEVRIYDASCDYTQQLRVDMLTACSQCSLHTAELVCRTFNTSLHQAQDQVSYGNRLNQQERPTDVGMAIFEQASAAAFELSRPRNTGYHYTGNDLPFSMYRDTDQQQRKPQPQPQPKEEEYVIPGAQHSKPSAPYVFKPTTKADIEKLLAIPNERWYRNGYNLAYDQYVKGGTLFPNNLPKASAKKLLDRLDRVNANYEVDIINRYISARAWVSAITCGSHPNPERESSKLRDELPIVEVTEMPKSGCTCTRGLVLNQLGFSNNVINFAYIGNDVVLTVTIPGKNNLFYKLPAVTSLSEVLIKLPDPYEFNSSMLVKLNIRGDIKYITFDPSILSSRPWFKELHVRSFIIAGYEGNTFTDNSIAMGEFSHVARLVVSGIYWARLPSFKYMFYKSGIVTVDHPFRVTNTLLDSIVDARCITGVFKDCHFLNAPKYDHPLINELFKPACNTKQQNRWPRRTVINNQHLYQ